jgi:hypothetical protein
MQFSPPVASSDSNAAESLALDRESFEYLASNPSSCHPGEIRAAVDRADYDDAAIRTLAACKLGISVPAELVADVLVGVDRIEVFLPLARQTTAALLLELLRRRRFADEPSGISQTSYAAFALWQLEASDVVRRSLLPRLRRLARYAGLPALASGFVAWLMTELDDPQLRSIYEKQQGAISDQQVNSFGQIMREFWSVPIAGIVSLLPQQVVEPQPTDVPVRAATKPGRNEPCPCGSGKKFKKCHREIALVPRGREPVVQSVYARSRRSWTTSRSASCREPISPSSTWFACGATRSSSWSDARCGFAIGIAQCWPAKTMFAGSATGLRQTRC